MLNVQTLVVGQLKANCYLVHANNFNECLIIDPGDEADFIIQKLSDNNLTPVGIVATHAHFDHIQAAMELKLAFGVPFYLHAGDMILLKHYRSSAKYFTGLDPGPAPDVDINLQGGEVLKTKGFALQVMTTPGHTPGSICLYSKNEKIIFTGDTIFAHGEVGRVDHKYSSPQDLEKSIQKILSLPGETTILPGHGETSMVDAIRQAPGLGQI